MEQSEHLQLRERILTRIRGFHISAGNAEAILKVAEAAKIPLEDVSTLLDDAGAANDDRERLKERIGKAAREAEARRAPSGLGWEGGIERNIDQAGADVFDRVMTVCKREFGPRHADTSGKLRLAICTGTRVEFRARTATMARIIDHHRGPTIRRTIREEFPHLGAVEICGPTGEAA